MNQHIFGVAPEDVSSVLLPDYQWRTVVAGTFVIDIAYGIQGCVSFQSDGWVGTIYVPLQNVLAVSKNS
jgi:hypothetical protein